MIYPTLLNFWLWNSAGSTIYYITAQESFSFSRLWLISLSISHYIAVKTLTERRDNIQIKKLKFTDVIKKIHIQNKDSNCI
jgi:hypothetical protein